MEAHQQSTVLGGIVAGSLYQLEPGALARAVTWVLDTPDADLADELHRRGALSEPDSALLKRMIAETVAMHTGDLAAALASFGGAERLEQTLGGTLVMRAGAPSVFEPASGGTSARRSSAFEANRYRPLREYARGGMGRVLLVRDEQVGRDVALKELLDGASPELAARFHREARITGQLEHPGIVPVHEIGEREDGTQYYTMKLVRGRTLAEAIEQAATLQDRLALLPHFIDLCQSISYAHSRGVIHRDLKPQNVIVGEFGETVVLDWGLAKVRSEPDDHADGFAEALELVDEGDDAAVAKTAYGAVMGTPMYMPPEQAKGRLDEVDEQSDVYSLGAVLYEILTGKPPFEPGPVKYVLTAVIRDNPRPVRDRAAEMPKELAAICEKALAKDRASRYPSAKALADEVQRFQSGALVQAHEYRTRDLINRFLHRHRPVVVSAAVAALLLMVVGVVSIVNILDARQREYEQRLDAEKARDRSERAQYQTGMQLAGSLVDDQEFLAAEDVLWDTPAKLRNWEWGVLLRECNPETLRFDSPFGALSSAEISNDERLIFLGGARGEGIVLDAVTGAEQFKAENMIRFHPMSGQFSGDGKRLLCASMQTLIYDVERGERILQIAGVEGKGAESDTLSPDGRYVIQINQVKPDEALIWLAENGAFRGKVPSAFGPLSTMAIDDGSDTVAMATQDGGIFVVDLNSLSTTKAFRESTSRINGLSFSANGNQLLVGSSSGTVTLWELEAGSAIWTSELTDEIVLDVDFQRQGPLAAAASSDGSVIVFEAQTGRLVGRLVGHSGRVTEVQFTSTGDRILTASNDGTARLWALGSALQDTSLGDDVRAAISLEVSRDDSSVALVPHHGFLDNYSASLFSTADCSERITVSGFGSTLNRIAINANGDTFAVATQNKGLYLVDSQSGTIVNDLRGHDWEVSDVDFSDAGDLVVSGSVDETVRVWDAYTGEQLARLDAFNQPILRAKFSPDGGAFAVGTARDRCSVWDSKTFTKIAEIAIPDARELQALAFRGTGNVLWIGTANQGIYEWNYAEGSLISFAPGTGSAVASIATLADDARLLGLDREGIVTVFDVRYREPILRFQSQYPDVPFGVEIANSTGGQTAYFADAHGYIRGWAPDRWVASNVTAGSGEGGREAYAATKRAERSKQDWVPEEARAARQIVLLPKGHVQMCASRLADVANVPSGPSDAPLRIDNDERYQLVRHLGLVRDDEIVRWDGFGGSDPATQSILVLRNGKERRVEFQPREPYFETTRVTFARQFIEMALASFDPLRASADDILTSQRALSAESWLPPKDDELDYLFVSEVDDDLADPLQSQWASILITLFHSLGLKNLDKVMEVNGIPMTSIDALIEAIETARPAIEAGTDFEYVMKVERTPFYHVEIHVKLI